MLLKPHQRTPKATSGEFEVWLWPHGARLSKLPDSAAYANQCNAVVSRARGRGLSEAVEAGHNTTPGQNQSKAHTDIIGQNSSETLAWTFT